MPLTSVRHRALVGVAAVVAAVLVILFVLGEWPGAGGKPDMPRPAGVSDEVRQPPDQAVILAMSNHGRRWQ